MGVCIAVASEKGGVSKTTTAIHLCAEFREDHPERSVLLCDADPQQAATRWAGEALPDVVVERVSSEDELFDHLPQWIEQNDLVVVDCAGGDTSIARAAMFSADCVVCPSGPTTLDQTATEATLKLVKTARRTRRSPLPMALLLPAKWGRTTLAGEIHEMLQGLGEIVLGPIPQRVALADAPTGGTVVWNGPDKELGELVRMRCDEILRLASKAHETRQEELS